MGSTESQNRHIKNKVLYSEVDVPFNKYLEILSRVTKLSDKILNGDLTDGENEGSKFDKQTLNDLQATSQLRFLDLQNSIDVKKTAFENWQQNNELTKNRINEKTKAALPQLKSINNGLLDRMQRIRNMYNSVETINKETESLSEGKTSITVTREQWENQLGKELTDKLIQERYLRIVNSSAGASIPKYRIYDDFSMGQEESKHFNNNMKRDITKLSSEVESYKQKWLNDANVFSRITDVLQSELSRRNMEIKNKEESEEEFDEESEEEDEEATFKRVQRENEEEEEEEDNSEEDIEMDDAMYEEEEKMLEQEENGDVEEEAEEEEREEEGGEENDVTMHSDEGVTDNDNIMIGEDKGHIGDEQSEDRMNTENIVERESSVSNESSTDPPL